MANSGYSGAGLTAGQPSSPPSAGGLWLAEARATFGLAWPLILTSLATIAISTTDVVMMGWLGPRELAAGALGHHLFFPMFLLGMGVVLSVAPIVAQHLGAGEAREVRRALRQGLWVSLVVGLPLSLLLWESGAFLRYLGQEAILAALAEDYLRAALWGLTPAFGFVALRGFVTAHGRTRAVLVITLMAVAINALGNYGLMFGNFGLPRLELVGAGISSSLVQLFTFVALLAFAVADPAFRRYRLLERFWRPDWPLFFEIWRVGLPIGLGIVSGSAFFSGTAILMGLIGEEALAAHAIALQSVGVSFMVPLGISQAAMVRVGLHAGAGDAASVGRAGWSALAIGLAFMVLTAAAFLFGGRTIIGFFLDLDQAANVMVGELAVSLLIIAACFQFGDGAQVILAGALRGLKDTRMPMVLAFIGFLPLGLASSWLLAFDAGFGPLGVWGGMVVGLYSVTVLMAWRFARRGDFWRPRPR